MKNNINKLHLGDLVNLSEAIDGANLPELLGEVIAIDTNSILVKLKDDGREIDLLTLKEETFPLPVRRDGFWGYAGRTGQIVIPFIFRSADAFENGLAWVSFTGRHYPFLINTRGEWVSEKNELRDGYMPIYVLQSEGRADLDECETVLGVFQDFETAAAYLQERSSMYRDDNTSVLFDQADCYWDSTHYLTIRERAVPKVNRGASIYTLTMTLKSNVIDMTDPVSFYSNKADLLRSFDAALSKHDHLDGLASLHSREAVSESKLYTIGAFVLQ